MEKLKASWIYRNAQESHQELSYWSHTKGNDKQMKGATQAEIASQQAAIKTNTESIANRYI